MAQPAQSTGRRDFLKLAAGAVGATGAPWIARNVQAKPTTIVFARESSYVKNFDEHFQKVMIPAYLKATGIKIDYQIQAAGGSAVPQLVSMVENKSGADLAWVQQEWLYRDALVDVSDIAEAVGKEQGGWYDEIKLLSVDNGKWKSVPQANIGQCMVYRKDWFDEAGIKQFPETWDEFLEAGIKLKAKGHPFGMSMGHGFADNYSWLYPLLWSYGVTVMDKAGKKVALDSSETAKAVEYVKRLYKEACIEDCIGWLDPHNNKAFLTSQISCTNNAYSIMVSAKRDLPEMGKVIDHALNPKGPNGQRYHALVPVTHGVFAYGPDPQAAKDFLRWIMDPKHESATIDGAGIWGRFRHVTLPSLLPVIFIVTTFSIILTFFDFQLVYVLTGGGPANSTHLMATYAYSLSVGAGQMGLGSAVALSMVPVLGLLLVLLTWYVRKD